jgi:hypothetical protein
MFRRRFGMFLVQERGQWGRNMSSLLYSSEVIQNPIKKRVKQV